MIAEYTIEEYCFQQSWRLRGRPKDSRWLIGLAFTELSERPPRAADEEVPQSYARIETRLAAAVHQRYGNPVVVWVLLNIIVPAIVKLVLEWWLEHKE